VTHPEPKSTPLPEDRVREAAIFEVVGTDLAGPLFMKDRTKAWIVIFTCAVFRAVHIELITSLTAEAFLQALRRFIARRGRPEIIYSDNGSNFVKAHDALSKLDWQRIEMQSTLKKITWKFIPPSAPWWGGWWERLIGTMKQILRRVLGQASLNYEELNTVLCDIESLINSRPLTYLSEDANDLVALSPSMFLQEARECGVPDIDKVDVAYMRKRYMYLQRVREDLRKRFRLEYLGQLQNVRKRTEDSKLISVGEIVLIGSDNLKRLQWPIGRVLEVLPGNDGIVRVVRIKTKSGIVTRPVQRVYPLEISENTEGTFLREKVLDNKKTAEDQEPDKFHQETEPVKTRSGRIVRPPVRMDI
jgi:transposase InsO family protein